MPKRKKLPAVKVLKTKRFSLYHLILFAAVSAVVGVTYLLFTRASGVALLTQEVEAMSSIGSSGAIINDTSASGGAALAYYHNATAGATINLASDATSVSFRGRGKSCKGQSQAKITLDGKTILNPTMSPSWAVSTAVISVPKGSHTLSVAFENEHITPSCTRTLYADNVVFYGSAPTASIGLSGISNGQTVSGSLLGIQAAVANTTPAKVDFLIDGNLTHSEAISPYCLAGDTNSICNSWDSKSIANGSHSLVAKAYDSAGTLLATSPTVTFTVNNLGHPQFYGINGQWIWNTSGVNKSAVLADMAKAGVKEVRFNTQWRYYEPYAPVNGVHNYSFKSQLDPMVLDLAKSGLRLHADISSAPTWAREYAVDNSPPSSAHMADYIAFLQAFVQRYGPNGQFWIDNPTVPKMPIQIYEIWNEQDAANGGNWSGSVSSTTWDANTAAPAEYAGIFRQTYSTIKAADPNAFVIVGGLAGGPSSMGRGTWMQRMMAADPTLPMDGIGIHPYAGQLSYVYSQIHDLRSALNAIPLLSSGAKSGATLAPLYVTEVGWSAGYPSDITTFKDNGFTPPSVQDANRKNYIYDLAMKLPASADNIAYLAPHTAITKEKDDSNWPYNREDWMGIWNFDGTRKPSAQSYASAISLNPGY